METPYVFFHGMDDPKPFIGSLNSTYHRWRQGHLTAWQRQCPNTHGLGKSWHKWMVWEWGISQFAIENCHRNNGFTVTYPLKMVIFPSYVSLPEGIPSKMVIYSNRHRKDSSTFINHEIVGPTLFSYKPWMYTYQNNFQINRNGHIETNQFIFVTENLRLAMGKHFHFTGQVVTCTLDKLDGPPALVGEERDSPDALWETLIYCIQYI